MKRSGVLSVSSRVCLRNVGNSVLEAAFSSLTPEIPLYTLDTVQWTAPGNHPQRTGVILPPDDLYTMMLSLLEIHQGENNSPLQLVIGYLRTPDQVQAVVRALEEAPPPASVLLDPILGDNGELYVEDATARAVRGQLLPRVDYLVPNLTEAIYLSTGETNDDGGDIVRLMKELMTEHPGIKGVAVTSAPTVVNEIGIYAVDRTGKNEYFSSVVIPGHYSGTGDCYTGALAAIMAENPGIDFLRAAGKAHQITVKALEAVASERAAVLGEALGKVNGQEK